MKQLITPDHCRARFGLIRFLRGKQTAIAGLYDGSMYEGSDRLSMAVAKHFKQYADHIETLGLTGLMEGDRFMNKTAISAFDPYVIRIADNGERGRLRRGSNQSPAHIKRIATRVAKFEAHAEVADSNEALEHILTILR